MSDFDFLKGQHDFAIRIAAEAVPAFAPAKPPGAMRPEEFDQCARFGVRDGDEGAWNVTRKWLAARAAAITKSRCKLGGLLWAAREIEKLPDDHPLAVECGPAIGTALHAFGVKDLPGSAAEIRDYVNKWTLPH